MPITSVEDLFAGSPTPNGCWLDPSDLSTMWQDEAGATPAEVDQPVGRMVDKIHGRVFSLDGGVTADRPILRSDGVHYWLEFDGAGDYLRTPATHVWTDGSGQHWAVGSASVDNISGIKQIINTHVQGFTAISQQLRVSGAAPQSIAFDPSARTDTGPSGIVAGEPFVLSSITQTGSVEAFLNGVGNGATSVPGTLNTGATKAAIGRQFNASEFLNGNIYQIILREGVPTSEEIAFARAWCAAEAIGQTVAVGLASETDAALAITAAKALGVGLASETNSAFAVGAAELRAVGLATETNTAFPVTTLKTRPAGPAGETEQAFAVTAAKARGAGLALEADLAFGVGRAKAREVGLAQETDTALVAFPAEARRRPVINVIQY